MSAIAGLLSLRGEPVASEVLDRVARAIPFIKTDRVDSWQSESVAMIQWTYATSRTHVGRGPHVDSRTGIVVALDGRIDNRKSLVIDSGIAARRQSIDDCALVAALYERHGESFLRHLVGDYAVAIWDGPRRRLLCSRAPVGWRPFFWHRSADMFAFATEPKALIDGLGLSRRPNEAALAEVISARFVSSTETVWECIDRLPPGWLLQVSGGQVRISQWHSAPTETVEGSERELTHRFMCLFDDAIRSSLDAGGPVTAELSGGVDSSSIVSRAVHLHREGKVENEMRPYTVSFPGLPQDESEWVTILEKFLGRPVTRVPAQPYPWDEASAWVRETLHLPVRPNAMALASIYEGARVAGSRVVVTGEGGDDWFPKAPAHWPGLLLQGRAVQVAREAWWRTRWDPYRVMRSFLVQGVGPLIVKRRRQDLAARGSGGTFSPPAWVDRSWAKRIELSERFRRAAPDARRRDLAGAFRAARYQDPSSYVLLENVVSFAAAHGLELRHPFHDLRLTRFLAALPGSAIVRGSEDKYLLRQAICGVVPELIRTRRTKAEFAPLFVDALSRFFSARPLLQLQPVKLGWVDADVLAKIFGDFLSWSRSGYRAPRPTSRLAAVWFTVAADIWLEQAAR